MKVIWHQAIGGNRGVLIIEDREFGTFTANLYVNVRNGFNHADITTFRWSGKTWNGLRMWTAKQLAVKPEDVEFERLDR